MRTNLAYYKKAFGEIDKGKIAPLYLFRGPETFIMEEMAAKIIDTLIQEDTRSFNLDVEYAPEVEIDTFISTANSYPFMAGKRVLILKELERMRGKWKNLIEYCAGPAASSVVVFFYNTHDDNNRRIRPPRDLAALEKAVSRNGDLILFERLTDSELKKWVRHKAKKMNFDMEGRAIDLLLDSIGTNLFDIKNELDKLSLIYENHSVNEEGVASVIGRYRLSAVYELIDGAGNGDDSRLLAILSRLINSGAERPSTIVYLLIRHFLSLLKIKTGVRAGGYQYEKMKRKADGFSTREVLTWLENLRITEILMKSVSFPEELLLVDALLHSSRGIVLSGASKR